MKKIIYVGQFTDASGYGSAARKYLRLLDKYLDINQYELKVYNSSYEGKDSISDKDLKILNKYILNNDQIIDYISKKDYIALFHLLPWDTVLIQDDKYKNKSIRENARVNINLSYWEADRLPEYWRDIFANQIYDKLILGSSWNKLVYEKDVSIPIDIIPVPISVPEIVIKPTDIFTIFSLSQWQPRKGFDILIKAFYQEFFNQDDVKLFIKTYKNEAFAKNVKNDKEEILKEALQYKNSVNHYSEKPKCKLEIKTGIVDYEELLSYYSNASIFCLASKGEGFSIPSAEAALYGLPTITADIGGHTDFLDKDNNFFFNVEPQPVENMFVSPLYSSIEMNFLSPNIFSLRKQLRKSYNIWKEDKNKLLEMGKNSRNYALKYFDEKEIFNKLMNCITFKE